MKDSLKDKLSSNMNKISNGRIKHFRLNKLSKLITTVFLFSSVLSGCQSLSSPSANLYHSLIGKNKQSNLQDEDNLTPVLQNEQSEQAKLLLRQTVDNMARHSFAYQTTYQLSNAKRLAALGQATAEQISNANSRDEHCEHVHDREYAAVLVDAEKSGFTIEKINKMLIDGKTNKYTAKLSHIRDEYINCYNHQRQWDLAELARSRQENANYYSHLNDTEGTAVMADEPEDAVETTDVKSTIDEQSIPYNNVEEFYPNYDYSHTELSIKQAELLDAYLLKNLTAENAGIYRPLSGAFTLSPKLNYNSKNMMLAVSQPIYIDLKAGNIYIWADALAFPMSEYLDNELGTSWANKWLKLSLNDKSLPSGFTKEFLLAHLEALKIRINSIDNNSIKIVLNQSDNQINSLVTDVPLPDGLDHDYYVEYQLTQKQIEEINEAFFTSIYEFVASNYPDLVADIEAERKLLRDKEPNKNNDAGNDIAEPYTKADINSAVNSVEQDEVESNNTNSDGDNKEKFNSEMMIKFYLALVYEMSGLDKQLQEENHVNNDNIEDAQQTGYQNLMQVLNSSNNESDEDEYIDDGIKSINQFGFEASGKLRWWRYQYRFPSDDGYETNIDNGEGIVITALTTFNNLGFNSSAFNELPENAQTPNAENSIDIEAYLTDLKQRYKDGGGTAIGRMLYMMYQLRTGDFDDEEDVDIDSTDPENNIENNSNDIENADAAVEIADLESNPATDTVTEVDDLENPLSDNEVEAKNLAKSHDSDINNTNTESVANDVIEIKETTTIIRVE